MKPIRRSRGSSVARCAFVVVAAAALVLATGLETGAAPGDQDKMIANPIDQRNQMIELLRSIDARLKSIDDRLSQPSK